MKPSNANCAAIAEILDPAETKYATYFFIFKIFRNYVLEVLSTSLNLINLQSFRINLFR